MSLYGRRGGPAILILFLFFLSCEDPSEIGLILTPENNPIEVVYDEIVLPFTLIQMDSLLTGYSGRLLCGNYEDQNFGKLYTAGYSQITYGDTRLSLPDSASLDSMVLNLDIDYSFGPGAYIPQQFFVHRLSEGLEDSIAYFSFSAAPYDPNPIGESSITVFAEADTTLRIRMNQEFSEELFNALLDTTVINPVEPIELINFIRGICLIPAQENTSVIGANVTSQNTNLTVYYKLNNDPRSYRFSLAYGVNFNQISNNKTGTPLEGIDNHKYSDFNASDERAYFQAGVNLIPKINLRPVNEYFDSIPNAVINSATLEIRIIEPEPNIKNPTSLFFYFSGENNKRIRFGSDYLGVPADGSADLVNPEYNTNKKNYEALITLFSEALRKGNSIYYDILVYPSNYSLVNTVNQFIAVPGDIRLKMYYTRKK